MFNLQLFIFISLFFLAGCGLTVDQKYYNVAAANINARLGIAYLQQNKIEIAKRKLLLAQKQAPYAAKVHAALGYFFAHTGEPVFAEKHYLYAIKCSHEKGGVWHDYGIFLSQQKRYREALRYFLLAARDVDYLFVAKAYVDASNAALQLKQKNLAQQYRKAAYLYDPYVFSMINQNSF